MTTNTIPSPDQDEGEKRALSRRQMLGRGGAALGGALAGAVASHQALAADAGVAFRKPAAQRSRMDEGARRSHGQPALRDAVAVREGRRQEHREEFAAIHLRFGADAVAGSRRHHHAERAVLRAPSWRRSHHRSGAASADAAWPGRPPDDFHDGRPPPLSVAIADSLPRMFGQSGLHQALRQDRLRSGGAAELRGVDRGQPETRAGRSRASPRSQMAGGRGRRCRGADAQHSDREMSRRCHAGLQPERRAAAAAAGLSAAAAAAGLRRQHEREVAAPAEGRRRAGLFARGDLEIHRPDAGRHRARIHLLHGSEIDHHPALGRTEAQAGRLSRDHRHRLERARQDQARRCLGRWRQELAGSRSCRSRC